VPGERQGLCALAAGDREDPHALGVAGACTASGAGPWPGAASGLMLPNRDRSGDPVTRGAEVDCVRVFSATMDAARWQGATLGRRPERRSWAGQSTPNRPQPASKDRFKRIGRCVSPRFCLVRGAMGKDKGRLKSLSSTRAGRRRWPGRPTGWRRSGRGEPLFQGVHVAFDLGSVQRHHGNAQARHVARKLCRRHVGQAG